MPNTATFTPRQRQNNALSKVLGRPYAIYADSPYLCVYINDDTYTLSQPVPLFVNANNLSSSQLSASNLTLFNSTYGVTVERKANVLLQRFHHFA